VLTIDKPLDSRLLRFSLDRILPVFLNFVDYNSIEAHASGDTRLGPPRKLGLDLNYDPVFFNLR
jgi:hypothetical protein